MSSKIKCQLVIYCSLTQNYYENSSLWIIFQNFLRFCNLKISRKGGLFEGITREIRQIFTNNYFKHFFVRNKFVSDGTFGTHAMMVTDLNSASGRVTWNVIVLGASTVIASNLILGALGKDWAVHGHDASGLANHDAESNTGEIWRPSLLSTKWSDSPCFSWEKLNRGKAKLFQPKDICSKENVM